MGMWKGQGTKVSTQNLFQRTAKKKKVNELDGLNDMRTAYKGT